MSVLRGTLVGMKSMPAGIVVVVVCMLGCVTFLAAIGKDSTVALTLGLTVLSAIGYGEIRAVREQTNGNTSKMLSIVDRAADRAEVRADRASGGPTDDGVSNGQDRPRVPTPVPGSDDSTDVPPGN